MSSEVEAATEGFEESDEDDGSEDEESDALSESELEPRRVLDPVPRESVLYQPEPLKCTCGAISTRLAMALQRGCSQGCSTGEPNGCCFS